MKKAILTVTIIMFTFLVLPFLFGYKAEAAGRDDYVKVGLKFGANSVAACTLESSEGFILGTAAGRSFQEGMPLPAYTKLNISIENGNIVIRDENGTLLSADLGSEGCIMPANYEAEGILYLDGVPYRDGFMFPAKSNGTMTVINYTTLEHYVYGVLNSELNHTNPKEALKAQAVAARSFGERNLGKHSSDGFDFCVSTHCQMFKGYSGEYKATNEAVDETEGELLYYNGEPVAAFYFKNSGGYTQNSEDVWSDQLPYLRAVKDEYSPSYPWNTSLSFDIIRTKLESAGFKPGTIQSFSVNGRNASGSVSELKITGSDATVYLRKENIRSVLGATIIKSNMFELADSTVSSGSGKWFISNGNIPVEPGSKIYVINGDGLLNRLEDANAYISSGGSAVRLGSPIAAETVTGGTVNFNGFGYGHGVGMPQDSAVEMAKRGLSYDKILKYFYTGIELD